ncbi:MAG TPA: hypothetical protein VKE73_05450 [Myxococcota bacterium]|nr:hypothetical protein [Myxococcota bacterium]
MTARHPLIGLARTSQREHFLDERSNRAEVDESRNPGQLSGIWLYDEEGGSQTKLRRTFL